MVGENAEGVRGREGVGNVGSGDRGRFAGDDRAYNVGLTGGAQAGGINNT